MRSATVVCVFLALLGIGRGQPPTMSPPFDPYCADKMNNCAAFGADACGAQYEDWARDNCNLTCGFCVGPSTNPPPCVDVLDNCASYGSNACTDPQFSGWANDNCRYTCQLCGSGVVYTTPSLAPDQCVDKLDCRLYSQSSCSGDYEEWAKDNCPVYCGFCPGVTNSEPPCLDKRPDCDHYETDMCTKPDYQIWVQDNCRAFCNLCHGSGSGAATTAGGPPRLTPPPLTTSPPRLTPPPVLTPPPLPGRK